MANSSRRQSHQIPAKKFSRVLDYMRSIELDDEAALQVIGFSRAQFAKLKPDDTLPAADYSRLYAAAVKQMQSLNRPIPWAAGIGSDAFELMCHSIISCRTLGEALHRAQRYDRLLYPLLGYRMSLQTDADSFELHYHVRTKSSEDTFAPEEWRWAEHFETVAHVSGLMVWYKFSSWLVGRSLELNELTAAGPYVSDAYEKSIARSFNCDIRYDAKASCIRGPVASLSYRIVHNPESLARFLENSVHELIAVADEPRSTTAAIRSLITRDFKEGLPSFKDMAAFLHCSESSLRRRLQGEDTSYQEIKDQLRCEWAIDHLRNRDTSINDLSELLGFAEPSSFVRSFRTWTGMTPSAFKEDAAAKSGAKSTTKN